MAEFKPSAMQQIIEALGRVKQEMEGGSLTRALLHLNTAEAAARAMQEQQAGVPWWKDPRNFEIAGAMIEAERRGQVHAGAASPSAPPVAGDERTSAAPEGLAAHAIEELCQLGYTVRDSQLVPPDNLHELARVAGWASPSGERARPVAGDSVQQPTRAMLAFWLNAMEKAHEDCTNQKQLAEAIAEVRAVIQQAAQPEAVPAWQPSFDACSANQERLAREFCLEIAGHRGQHGSPPDPVRLLEMAQAMYEAERADLAPSNPEAQQAAKPVATPDMAKIEQDAVSNAMLLCLPKITQAYRYFYAQGKTEKDFDRCAGEAMGEAVKYAVKLTAREVREPVWPYAASPTAPAPATLKE